jgi:hypothetical protein
MLCATDQGETMTTHRVITSWTGFCASCPVEQPLLLVETGPHGLRGWLSGAGPEDRTLSYACAVCGRVEHVPASEEEDAAYDATLVRWPDWVEEPLAAVAQVESLEVEASEVAAALPAAPLDVFAMAALEMAVSLPVVEPAAPAPVAVVPAPRTGAVQIVRLPVQRVSATDLLVAAA